MPFGEFFVIKTQLNVIDRRFAWMTYKTLCAQHNIRHVRLTVNRGMGKNIRFFIHLWQSCACIRLTTDDSCLITRWISPAIGTGRLLGTSIVKASLNLRASFARVTHRARALPWSGIPICLSSNRYAPRRWPATRPRGSVLSRRDSRIRFLFVAYFVQSRKANHALPQSPSITSLARTLRHEDVKERYMPIARAVA